MSAGGFATVVLSAVTASAVWRAFFGNAPVLRAPAFALSNPLELPAYVGLGLAAAVAAIGFVTFLCWLGDRFDGMRRFCPTHVPR